MREQALDVGRETQDKIVRRAWLAFQDRGLAGMLDHCSGDVTWRSFVANGREVRGRTGIVEMFDGLAQHQISYTASPVNYEVIGPNVLVAVDAAITSRDGTPNVFLVFILYEVEAAMITAVREYVDRSDAVAAAQSARSGDR